MAEVERKSDRWVNILATVLIAVSVGVGIYVLAHDRGFSEARYLYNGHASEELLAPGEYHTEWYRSCPSQVGRLGRFEAVFMTLDEKSQAVCRLHRVGFKPPENFTVGEDHQLVMQKRPPIEARGESVVETPGSTMTSLESEPVVEAGPAPAAESG